MEIICIQMTDEFSYQKIHLARDSAWRYHLLTCSIYSSVYLASNNINKTQNLNLQTWTNLGILKTLLKYFMKSRNYYLKMRLDYRENLQKVSI